jgi:hypothetical protein
VLGSTTTWFGSLEGICAPIDELDFNKSVREPAGGRQVKPRRLKFTTFALLMIWTFGAMSVTGQVRQACQPFDGRCVTVAPPNLSRSTVPARKSVPRTADGKPDFTGVWAGPGFMLVSYEVTIDDPKYFTKPWSEEFHMVFHPTWNLLEFVCKENDRAAPASVSNRMRKNRTADRQGEIRI